MSIDLKLGARAIAIDAKRRQVELADASRHYYDALLIATGLILCGSRFPVRPAACPRPPLLADSRAIVAQISQARRQLEPASRVRMILYRAFRKALELQR
jgi:NADH dehydrogenase FAD-containing subunit